MISIRQAFLTTEIQLINAFWLQK